MRTQPAIHLFALSVCLAALAPGSARSQAPAEVPAQTPAQTPAETPAAFASSLPESGGRALNGHTFIPAAGVRWPFATTSFASYLVLSYGQTTGSTTIGDQTFEGTLKYAGVGGILGYEHAFGENVSVRAALDEIIYSGIDGKSALTVGSTAQLGFGLGATASLPIGETARLGVLLDVSSNPNLALTIGSGIRDIVDSCSEPSGCDVDSGTIFGSTRVVTIQPAIAGSWAPARQLGLTANIAYQRLNSSGATSIDGNAVKFGAAADFDFGEETSVPVGLLLSISWLTPLGDATGIQHVTDLGVGIFYTGRENLSAGLQVISRRFAVSPNVDVSWETYIAATGLRYFW